MEVLPISRNIRKTTYLATDRTYEMNRINEFVDAYKGKELELALYDTNPSEDSDWLNLYNKYLFK